MAVSDITTLATSSFGDLGTGALAVLTLAIGIIVALVVYHFVVRKIKGAVK